MKVARPSPSVDIRRYVLITNDLDARHEDANAIMKLKAAWPLAMQTKDKASFERILAKDFTFIVNGVLLYARLMRAGSCWATTLLLPCCFFMALAFVHALALAGNWGPWLWNVREYTELCAAVGIVPVVIVVSIVDRCRSPNRDWLHWCGVSFLVMVAATFAVNRLYWLIWQ